MRILAVVFLREEDGCHQQVLHENRVLQRAGEMKLENHELVAVVLCEDERQYSLAILDRMPPGVDKVILLPIAHIGNLNKLVISSEIGKAVANTLGDVDVLLTEEDPAAAADLPLHLETVYTNSRQVLFESYRNDGVNAMFLDIPSEFTLLSRSCFARPVLA